MEKIEKIGNIVTESLSPDKEVVAIYLFGSYGRGEIGPMSDIDVGILLDKELSKDRYTEKRLELMSKIVSAVKSDKVDVVIMNGAPLTLTYQIIRINSILFERNRLQRVEFEAKTMDEYFDTLFIRRHYFEKMMERIKKGGFGGYRSRTYQDSLAKVRRVYQKA